MTGPLRVLYYNWVDYLDDEGRGGGVSVYQRNLMAWLADLPDVDPVFLSAGLSYDLPAGLPRWEPVRHGPHQDRDRRFEIVNSGVLAPSHHSFGEATQLKHTATQETFFDFIEKTGPYDVVHFNNIEGLPASVLKLKQHWPQTRVILSLHNYYPFCPQVNLWYDEREICHDFAGGRHCRNCLPHRHDARLLRMANGVAYRLKKAGMRPGGRAFELTFRWAMHTGRRALRGLGRLHGNFRGSEKNGRSVAETSAAAHFAARRHMMVGLINSHCDRVLCVSDAAAKIARDYGIKGELVQTGHIGTREAEAYARTSPRPALPAEDGTLSLGYLGYLRRDKGFYFMLEALETLPGKMARRLHLVIAARRGNKQVMARIEALRDRLAGLHHVDGYRHDDLDELLGQVDVGVIPVLWHDNLPQVAIEMHARHIPLLTSDLGGARELGRCSDMEFPAGDIAAFHDRISDLLEGRVDMDAYWRGAIAPVDMRSHVAALMRHYCS